MPLTTGELTLAAIIGTLGGTFGGAWFQARRDDRQRREEREAERERWQRENVGRWAEHRRSAHADFLGWSRQYTESLYDYTLKYDESNEFPPDPDHVIQTGSEALSALETLATPETRKAATALYFTLLRAATSASLLESARFGEDDHRNHLYKTVGEFVERAKQERSHYLDLVQQEIGTAELPPS